MTDVASPTHACASGDTPPSAYDRIGGSAGVTALVARFYQRMDTLPEAAGIRALHRADLTETQNVLVRYLGEWLGGPKLYSAERGHPRLRQRHLHIPIGPTERDAWLSCMTGALDETVADPEVKATLLAFFTKFADWVRNDSDNAHDKHR